MKFRSFVACAASMVAMVAPAGAQSADSARLADLKRQVDLQKAAEQLKASQYPITVRTFALQYMHPDDAAKLVTPYVDYTPSGGVFSAGSVRGITVRGMAPVLARVDSLLKANDRAPDRVRLNYQVIAAVDSAGIDPAIASLESGLRSVLKFNGYRLIAQGAVTGSENEMSEVTMDAGPYQNLLAQTRVTRIDRSGDHGGVSMYVSLQGAYVTVNAANNSTILNTGLTAPFGEAVVVGTGAPLRLPMVNVPGNTYRALILVVRAELVTRQ